MYSCAYFIASNYVYLLKLYRVALRMIKTCCEETSEKLACDFKNYLNNSIYKLEGQRKMYDRIIAGTCMIVLFVLL